MGVSEFVHEPGPVLDAVLVALSCSHDGRLGCGPNPTGRRSGRSPRFRATPSIEEFIEIHRIHRRYETTTLHLRGLSAASSPTDRSGPPGHPPHVARDAVVGTRHRSDVLDDEIAGEAVYRPGRSAGTRCRTDRRAHRAPWRGHLPGRRTGLAMLSDGAAPRPDVETRAQAIPRWLRSLWG